jgi:succinyl-CoA synthetase beta subunit
MNIHEYQAKELLQRFGVATPPGKAARTPDEAEQAARELGTQDLVVKAQVHAGGRGKGTFANGFKGGVQLCKSPEEARELASKMLGQTLVTHQTGAAGRVVNTVLIAQSVEIEREIYFAILVDRATGAPMIVASTEGGVEIEAVAEKSPEKIIREPIDRLAGIQPYQTRKLARQLGFTSAQIKAASKLFDGLYRTFVALDCSMVEVNPLVVTDKARCSRSMRSSTSTTTRSTGTPKSLHCATRRKKIPRGRSFEVRPQLHRPRRQHRLSRERRRPRDGDDGHHQVLRRQPANFLDVGGGATEEQVTQAFKLLVSDENVKAILVNIFGGIMRCDVIAQGIVNAVKAVNLPVPSSCGLKGRMSKKASRSSPTRVFPLPPPMI